MNIYLDNDGNYRDKTEENLAAYPPAGTEPEGEPTAEEPAVAKTRKQS